MGKTKHTLDEFLEAVKGSGGIKQMIADRLGVARNTVDNYLGRWATARLAYEQECAVNLDIAESIVITNMRLQHQKQLAGKVPVDSGDAKWFIKMKGDERGYIPKHLLELKHLLEVADMSDEELARKHANLVGEITEPDD